MMPAPQRDLFPDRDRERRAAGDGPRDLKTRGSPEWCWQTASDLRRIWQSEQLTMQEWRRTIEDLCQTEAWTKIPEDRPYGSLDALLREIIGIDRATADMTLAEREAKLSAMAPQPTKAAAAQSKERAETGHFTTSDIITCGQRAESSERGTSANYLLARLKRDAPEIAEAWARGEHKSVRAAAIAAGILKPTDPVERARKALRSLPEEQRAEVIFDAIWKLDRSAFEHLWGRLARAATGGKR